MVKKLVWIIVSSLMVLSLLMAACGQATTPTTPTTPTTSTTPATSPTPTTPSTPTESPTQEVVVEDTGPKYGGILRLSVPGDITTWDDVVTIGYGPGRVNSLTNQTMWSGDWAKGPAGGYGSNDTDWVGWYDVFDNHVGHLAESWEWTLDSENDKGTLVYQVRQGVHYGLDPDREASRLVGGREMTADDVVFSLSQPLSHDIAYMYRAYPELRDAEITKTGPWEVTIDVSSAAGLITAVAKFGSYVRIVPPEVVDRYGDMADWENSVGTGAFIIKDYVAGSLATLVRNDEFWQTDPIGPGQGNQLPYIDGLQYLIIPDASTRQAALRTGRIDWMDNLGYEDSAIMRQSAPGLMEGPGTLGGPTYYIYMNSQRAPFDDARVRRALTMATDLEAIRDSLNHGLGQILTWPVEYVSAYKDIYLGLDDPEMPESVKELYVYNPDKAKTVLTEAGYPDGFKTTALISQTEVDYFSIIKDMWAKVGVDLELNVREVGSRNTIYRTGDYEIVGAAGGRGPLSVFYHMVTMVGEGPDGGNGANIDDPVMDAASDRMQQLYLVDSKAAMAEFKELMKYVLDQAYVVSRPIAPLTTFWWPWVKNYSGERSIGYIMYDSWSKFIWIDQELKESMGY